MIYLDSETLDFFSDPHIKSLPRAEQIATMRFGCAVTFDSESGEWREWLPDQILDLYGYLFSYSSNTLVGWNISDFDVHVIAYNAMAAPGYKGDLADLMVHQIDLFAMIRQQTGRWYKLDSVAERNLGRSKLADGQSAAEWLRSGDPALAAKALEYCREDVQIVVDLHAKLLAGESLILPRRPERQELNDLRWSLATWERIVGEDGVLGVR